MAIHRYPSDMISQWRLKDGTEVLVRPLLPEDAEMEQRFVRQLSAQTRYFRFMSSLRELSPSLLTKLTQMDGEREMALIATIELPVEQAGEIVGIEVEIGVCRYAAEPDGRSCEFAIVIADAWQSAGLGRYLMTQLIGAARSRGFKTMKGVFLASNERMLRFVQSMGFIVRKDPSDATMRHGELDLTL
ncbi:MAG: family N-acetyltransferase [Rhodocyclales bacterium]|nr:family N-acetyltransferase [Rhodocyclales bacterium]